MGPQKNEGIMLKMFQISFLWHLQKAPSREGPLLTTCKKPCTSSPLFNSNLNWPIRAETNQNIPQKLWRRVEKSGFWRLITLQLLSLYDSGARRRLRLCVPSFLPILFPNWLPASVEIEYLPYEMVWPYSNSLPYFSQKFNCTLIPPTHTFPKSSTVLSLGLVFL